MNSHISMRFALTNPFRRLSLKTRMALFTLAIFLIGIWSLDYFASRMLREDMQQLLGVQQSSLVSFMAAEINDRLDDRLHALEAVAASIDPALLGNPAALQALLEQRPILQVMFNAGVIASGLDGIAIADVPLTSGRLGVNYMDRDHIAGALKTGKAMVGKPVMGKKAQAPIIGMAVPIRDPQGKVIGSLAGVTNLDKPNFLDRITSQSDNKSSGYLLLVAAQHRLIVTASVKSRIMETLPAPGSALELDRYIRGEEVTGVVVNPQGVEVLTSAKGIPVAGWYLRAALPTAEAFAPIRTMQQRMLLATILLTLLAGSLTWWMLKYQLSPLFATMKTMAAMADTRLPLQRLPVTRQDEIGQLIGGFNRLLENLGRTNADLKRFAEVTAHHLQEPARRLVTYADRLSTQLGGQLEDAETRLSLEFIGQQARRQQNLLRDIERYLAADQPRGAVKNLDAGKTVAGLLARMPARLAEAGAEIKIGELPWVRIDAPRLEDVFAVALDNALIHGRSDHSLRITIEGERQRVGQGGKVRYSISDNGTGVEMQYREQVFGVFERLSSSHGGTGIGLAILRRVVESCAGRAWIEEVPGGGCRLLFELPMGEEPH